MTIPFAGGLIDRAAGLRSDSAWLDTQLEAGLVLPLWRGQPLVEDNKAKFLPWRSAWAGAPRVFLGLDADRALFAVELEAEAPDLGAFMDMRAAAFVLPQFAQ